MLHALVVGLIVLHGDRLLNRTFAPGNSARPGDSSGGGGGGNRVAYITLPSMPEPAPAPPVRVPAPVPPPTSVQTPVPPDLALSVPADTAPGIADAGQSSQAADTGTGTGVGGPGGAPGTGGQGAGGAGGTGEGGQGDTLRPPEPRDMAFPFDNPPKELRGVSLSVKFWVGADGRVERYQVMPQIKDREYAKKFDEVMRAFRFTPARAPNGARVAGTYSISFTLPGKSSS